MARGSMETELMSDPTIKLPDDLLVEIVSRVPYKSTCCCKCVSTRWRDLVSHPDHREKLPRSTLAGFFYKTRGMGRDGRFPHVYQSVSGNWCPLDASLSFLPECEKLDILDCCNDLLLCRRRTARKKLDHRRTLEYVVCNPATEKWVTFPATQYSWLVDDARLGFDPAFSSHFHVFDLVTVVASNLNYKYDYRIKKVEIYSSKAGGWTHHIVWDNPIEILCLSGGTFFSGVLYLCADNNSVAAVDVESNCRIIPIPTSPDARGVPNVYVSQGQLYLTDHGSSELSIWVLEDSIGENCWTMKLKVSYLQLVGVEYSSAGEHYGVISAHPEHDEIFITVESASGFFSQMKLFSYEMDSKELRFVCDLGWNSRCPYLPYVPLFSESLTDGH
ncbi:F-box protein At5g07610-like [Triticum dicoccoides]|uniref:F-box protein At5g07610-like n=1 Tax=Triticum dicoccoides TaxID=85692 RepID=UPI000E7AF786|nr:F-box protein At5g07610-like [Triticum dicoccoides]